MKTDATGKNANQQLFIKLISMFELIGKHSSNQITGKTSDTSLFLSKFSVDEATAAQIAIAWYWIVGYVATLIPKAILTISASIIGVIGFVAENLAQLKRITQIDVMKFIQNDIKNTFVLNMASTNLFGNVIPGDYIFGIYSIVEEPSKKILQYKTHNYLFMIGPSGTSLEFAFYIPWNGAIKI